MTLFADHLHTAIRAARAAGAIHLAYAGRAFGVRSKTTLGDLVTEVDTLAEAEIRRLLLADFPEHAILGEEEGLVGEIREARWVVDPLDGTVNYAHGFPVYCVSIGFEQHGERMVGVVYDPTRDELFTAVKGEGAFLNGQQIQVSTTEPLATPALLATGFPYNVAQDARNLDLLRRALALGLPVRRAGAAALDLCYVACGRFDGYWEFGLKPWDAAAGSLIVEEAGGRVSDGQGRPTPYGPMIVASNKVLHEELLGMLR
nr:inositol monophosphatase family protein [Deinococcus peraridilitoris]